MSAWAQKSILPMGFWDYIKWTLHSGWCVERAHNETYTALETNSFQFSRPKCLLLYSKRVGEKHLEWLAQIKYYHEEIKYFLELKWYMFKGSSHCLTPPHLPNCRKIPSWFAIPETLGLLILVLSKDHRKVELILLRTYLWVSYTF